jgi:hypothetical protein
VSLRSWPATFPTEIIRQRIAPYESQADPVMYRQELATAASARGWRVEHFGAKTVEADALRVLGDPGGDPLQRPRTVLGPPWTKDHRTAFAAAILAGRSP